MKPNWIGPRATMRTQARTETELSRIAWDEPIILDCLDPILYQLPVWRNGFRRSPLPPSSLSSPLKLISVAENWSWKVLRERERAQTKTVLVLCSLLSLSLWSVEYRSLTRASCYLQSRLLFSRGDTCLFCNCSVFSFIINLLQFVFIILFIRHEIKWFQSLHC